MKSAWEWDFGNKKSYLVKEYMLKPYITSKLSLVFCFLLLGCEQKIIQNVNVLPATATQIPKAGSSNPVETTLRPDKPSNLASPMIKPSIKPQGPSNTSSILPDIEQAPIIGPSPTPIFKADIEKFEYTIVEPDRTQSYNQYDIEIASAFWLKRYERLKKDPYQVLKMYFDAALIAKYNENLTTELNKIMMYTKTSWLFPNFAQMDAQAIAKAKEYAIRSYYKNTLELNNYTLPDFQKRTLHTVNKNSRGEYVDLTQQDINSLAPKDPADGQEFKIKIYSQATQKDAEITLIYKRGWKINFWTPNILVLFL